MHLLSVHISAVNKCLFINSFETLSTLFCQLAQPLHVVFAELH